VVGRGEIIFVSDLPARVALSEGIIVGAPLGGGEDAFPEGCWKLPSSRYPPSNNETSYR